MRSKAYKYIRYFDKAKDQHHILSLTASIRGEQPIYEELYDIENDPQEVKNLAASPAHSKVLEELRGRCHEFVVEAKGGSDYPKTYLKNDPRNK